MNETGYAGHAKYPGSASSNEAYRMMAWHDGPSCKVSFLDVGGFLWCVCTVCCCACNMQAVSQRESWNESAIPGRWTPPGAGGKS